MFFPFHLTVESLDIIKVWRWTALLRYPSRSSRATVLLARLRNSTILLCLLGLSSAWSLIIIFLEDSLKKSPHIRTTLTSPHSLCILHDLNNSLQLLNLKYLISVKMIVRNIWTPGLSPTAYIYYISDLSHIPLSLNRCFIRGTMNKHAALDPELLGSKPLAPHLLSHRFLFPCGH